MIALFLLLNFRIDACIAQAVFGNGVIAQNAFELKIEAFSYSAAPYIFRIAADFYAVRFKIFKSESGNALHSFRHIAFAFKTVVDPVADFELPDFPVDAVKPCRANEFPGFF